MDITKSFILLITLVSFFILIKKYKLNKYQLQIFIMTTLFWTSVKLIRSFRVVYAKELLGVEEVAMIAAIAGGYGLVSIFLRLPMGAFSDKFKSRKLFVYFSMIAVLVTSVAVFYNPQYTTLLLSVYAMGFAASAWGLINVMFAEAFEEKQLFAAVSILSIAPLLSDYIAAPLQSMAREAGDTKAIWLASAIFALATLLFTLTIKEAEYRGNSFSFETLKKIVLNKKIWLISLLGMGVLFIKFANGGSNAQALAETLGMSASLEGYFLTMFSFPQLIAGILLGTFFKNKIGIKNTVLFGLSLVFIYNFIAGFTTNPIVLFFAFILNGFSYGLTYNAMLGLAMSLFTDNERGTAMGFYQSVIAIGIYYGSKLTAKFALLFDSYNQVHLGLNAIVVVLFIVTLLVFDKVNSEA